MQIFKLIFFNVIVKSFIKNIFINFQLYKVVKIITNTENLN